MAELMSTVSAAMGIASFAVQVVDSALKFKELLDDIKEAPQEIAYIITKIDMQRAILENIRDCDSKGPLKVDRSIVKGCISYCEKFNEDLVGAMKELESKRNRKGKFLAGVTFVLKKETLKKLQRRLDSGHDLLSQAQICYTNALSIYTSSIMEERFAIIQNYMLKHEFSAQPIPRMQIDGSANYLQVSPSPGLDSKSLSPPSVFTNTPSSDTEVDEVVYGNCVTSQPEPTTSTKTTLEVYSPRNPWIQYFVGSFEYWKVLQKNRKVTERFKNIEENEHRARLRIPAWFSQKSWEVCAQQAQNGWNFKLRVHPVVPATSRSWELVSEGDAEGLRMMFDKGEASPFDVMEDDSSYLHLATYQSKVDVCRLLVEYGADISAATSWVTPIHNTLLASVGVWRHEDNTFGIEILKILLQDQDVNTLQFIAPPTEELSFNNSIAPDVQRHMQSYVYPPYEQLPLQERLEYTLRQEWLNIENIRIAMCGNELDPIDSKAFSLCNSYKKTLFHTIARVSLEAYHCPRNQFVHSECQRLFREAVQAQTDLCAVTLETGYEHARHTPLMALFHAYGRGYCYARRTPPDVSMKDWKLSNLYELGDLLRFFIIELHRAGLSGDQIITYGTQEQLVHRSGILDRDIEIAIMSRYPDDLKRIRIRILGFKYGPTFRHWSVWTSNPLDEWAGEFWAIIEKPALHVPGAWIDEDI